MTDLTEQDAAKKNFGQRVAQFRELHRITKAELARRVGVSGTTISKIEGGSGCRPALASRLEAQMGPGADPQAGASSESAKPINADIAVRWANQILRKAAAVATQDFRPQIELARNVANAKLPASSRPARGGRKERETQETAIDQTLLKIIRAAIQDGVCAGRPISMLFLCAPIFNSALSREEFIDCVVLSAAMKQRLLYATIETINRVVEAFDNSHFCLMLEAAIAASIAEAHIAGGPSRQTDRDEPRSSFGCRSFGASSLSLLPASLQMPITDIGVGLVAVPNRSFVVAVPAALIHQPRVSFEASAARDVGVVHATEMFEKSLQVRDPHIVVYARNDDEQYWKREAAIEDRPGLRRAVHRFFSTATRPINYYKEGGRWFQSVLQRVGNDRKKVESIAFHRQLRAMRIRERLQNGAQYREICDLATIHNWLETGERPDVPLNFANPGAYVDDVPARIERLAEVEDLLSVANNSFELAFVKDFDQLIYGLAQPGLPKHGWAVTDVEYTIIEVNCDADPTVQQLRVVLRDKAVSEAFATWFDACWERTHEDERDRQINLERVREWTAHLEKRQAKRKK